MHTHQEITEVFITLLEHLAFKNRLSQFEKDLVSRYTQEYYTFYADDAEGRDIE